VPWLWCDIICLHAWEISWFGCQVGSTIGDDSVTKKFSSIEICAYGFRCFTVRHITQERFLRNLRTSVEEWQQRPAIVIEIMLPPYIGGWQEQDDCKKHDADPLPGNCCSSEWVPSHRCASLFRGCRRLVGWYLQGGGFPAAYGMMWCRRLVMWKNQGACMDRVPDERKTKVLWDKKKLPFWDHCCQVG